jgi:hypothetical protein
MKYQIYIFLLLLLLKFEKNRRTLDLLALIPFKLQLSQLVSLCKFSHCGYKK